MEQSHRRIVVAFAVNPGGSFLLLLVDLDAVDDAADVDAVVADVDASFCTLLLFWSPLCFTPRPLPLLPLFGMVCCLEHHLDL